MGKVSMNFELIEGRKTGDKPRWLSSEGWE